MHFMYRKSQEKDKNNINFHDKPTEKEFIQWYFIKCIFSCIELNFCLTK